MHVVPKPGQAALFSYRGTDGAIGARAPPLALGDAAELPHPPPISSSLFKGTTDTGLTEHSGCPVKEGEKWVATQWMREGVNTKETWMLFDPQGGRL